MGNFLRSTLAVASLCGAVVALGQNSEARDFGVFARRVLARYPIGAPSKNVQPLNQLVITLDKSSNDKDFAARHKLTKTRTFFSDPRTGVYKMPVVKNETAYLREIKRDQSVENFWKDYRVLGEKCSFIPNDLLANPRNFAGEIPRSDAQHVGQFMLDATGARDAFYNGYTGMTPDLSLVGTNVPTSIGFLDDGFDYSHEDLDQNVDLIYDRDFRDGDDDPYMGLASENHGTAMMGIVGALGGNEIGMTGLAPRSLLTGLRIDWAAGAASAYVDAIRYNRPFERFKIKVHGGLLNAPLHASLDAQAALEASTDDGTIHVFPSGNAGAFGPYVPSQNGLLTNPNAIVVSGYAHDDALITDSETGSGSGSNVFCTMPTSWSSAFTEDDGTETTIRRGVTTLQAREVTRIPTFTTGFPNGYTDGFGGSSAAAAGLTGVLGLVAEANSSLNLRFAKHLLVRNSRRLDDMSGTWVTNGAGKAFSPLFGFGVPDAVGMIQDAHRYSGVTPLVYNEVMNSRVLSIASHTSADISLRVTDPTPLEEAILHLTLDSISPAGIVVTLESPQGTQSVLVNGDEPGLSTAYRWMHLSNAFWGENPRGTWTVHIENRASAPLTFNFARLVTRHGTVVTRPSVDSALCSEFRVSREPMYIGRPYSVQVEMRNTGTETWHPGSHRLVSDLPLGNRTWGTAGAELATDILPGMSARFTLTVTAPAVADRYAMRWRMANMGGPMDNPTPARSFEVIEGDDATTTFTGYSGLAYSGAPILIEVPVTNMGSTTWTAADGYGLYAWNPPGNPAWGTTFVPLAPGDRIAPGQTKRFSFTVTAPVVSGSAPMAWRMMRMGTGAFGDPTRTVTLGLSGDRGEYVSHSIEPGLVAGGTSTLTMRFRNTGITDWTPARFNFGCLTREAAVTWGFVGEPLPAVVRPGEEIEIAVNIHCTATPGSYDFSFGIFNSLSHQVLASWGETVEL